jgi:hypothetical protein
MKGRQQLVVIVVALVGAYGLAQYPGMQPLTGEFDITGRTAVDPSPGEPRNTHFRMHLTGEAARTLYDQMQVAPRPSPCGDHPERQVKRIGDTLCSTDGRIFECFLAINVQEQRVEGGWDTC